MLDQSLIPILARVFTFFGENPGGTDEMFQQSELKRTYLQFLTNIFSSESQMIFLSNGNLIFMFYYDK